MNNIHRPILSDDLSNWFLRLNGFFTNQNFIIHHETSSNQETEIDIFGVRFPDRRELDDGVTHMIDYEYFSSKNKIHIVFAEVTIGECKLNGPWKYVERICRALRALGTHKEVHSLRIAKKLKKYGVYEIGNYRFSFLMIGSEKSKSFAYSFPEVKQILFQDICVFIYNRFDAYRIQKSDHKQWDSTGKYLWTLYESAEYESSDGDGAECFTKKVLFRLK